MGAYSGAQGKSYLCDWMYGQALKFLQWTRHHYRLMWVEAETKNSSTLNYFFDSSDLQSLFVVTCNMFAVLKIKTFDLQLNLSGQRQPNFVYYL